MGLLQTYTGEVGECGVDEVGRGCLAGPVVACAVILPKGFYLASLRDSKKMSPLQRESADRFIRSSAVVFAIGEISPARIDKINILQSTFEAMHQAIDKLGQKPSHIICDGNQFRPYDDVPFTTIIKGDDLYMSIAAASVLAKVYRDNLMVKLSAEFPGYDWAENKGYGTPKHIAGIKKLGITEYHRKTFINTKMVSE